MLGAASFSVVRELPVEFVSACVFARPENGPRALPHAASVLLVDFSHLGFMLSEERITTHLVLIKAGGWRGIARRTSIGHIAVTILIVWVRLGGTSVLGSGAGHVGSVARVVLVILVVLVFIPSPID